MTFLLTNLNKSITSQPRPPVRHTILHHDTFFFLFRAFITELTFSPLYVCLLSISILQDVKNFVLITAVSQESKYSA